MFPIVQAPDPRLRVKTKPVKKITSHHHQIIKEMIKLTKTFVDPEGVGLASTQIGEMEQFFILRLADGQFKAYFNPQILKYSKRKREFFEGCLSIPNYWGEIKRPAAVTVSYWDLQGKVVKERLTELEAWFFQHEYDHLQGRLYMDKVLEQKGKLYKVVGKDRAGADVFERVAL